MGQHEERWNQLRSVRCNIKTMVGRGEIDALVNFVFTALASRETGQPRPTGESQIAMAEILKAIVDRGDIVAAEDFRRKYDAQLFFLDKWFFDREFGNALLVEDQQAA